LIEPEIGGCMNEAINKKVVFTFGRFQPPTSGHQLLIEKVQQVAKKLGAEHRIYPSPSHDTKQNPLSHSDKVKYMKKMFRGANIINDKKMINPFKVAEQLSEQGYTHVTMVVGSDRVQEFKKGIGKYVGPDGYNFKFNVVSAGKRDPDAEGVVGMSGSKMRQAVKDDDLSSFSTGVPSGVNKRDIQGLFKAIKKGMGLKERRILTFGEHEEYALFEEKKKLLKEPEVLDTLVRKLMDKGMDKDKAYAIATTQLQKKGVLKKGSHELEEKPFLKKIGMDKFSRSERKRKKKISKANKRYSRNILGLRDSKESVKYEYEFKESHTHGMGTFAVRDIEEGKQVGLFLVNLLREYLTYQRTDFCRFTNHSTEDFNIALEQVGNHLYAKATKNIEEGEELLINYFHIFESIGGRNTAIIKEVLRWTEGYDDLVIGEDTMEDITIELEHLAKLDEISREARIRMSRAAKRTAKKRAKTRERKKKLKKSGARLKTLAQKGARDFFKKKFLRGKQWSNLSHSEKERIDARLKKIKPAKLKRLQTKLLPGIRKSERERIASLRDLKNKPGDVDEAKVRDYKKEYKEYHSRPEQRANRSKRVLARRKLEKEGRVTKGDGKDVDHRDGNAQNNSDSNLRVINRHLNRSRNNNKGK